LSRGPCVVGRQSVGRGPKFTSGLDGTLPPSAAAAPRPTSRRSPVVYSDPNAARAPVRIPLPNQRSIQGRGGVTGARRGEPVAQ